MTYDIVFLLEESSIENVLEELLPKLIPPEISYTENKSLCPLLLLYVLNPQKPV